MIELEIHETPLSWLAPIASGKIHFNPRAVEKTATRRKIADLFKKPPISTPVSLEFIFNFRPPKSASKKKRALMIEGKTIPTKKDVTNLVKFYEDCLKGIAFVDDRIVFQIFATKKYSEKNSIIIKIITIEEINSYAT